MTAHHRPNGEPNVTPLIDVLLVLLITFMVLVVSERRTMDVQLPVRCTGSCQSGDAIVLEVFPHGTYRLNQQPVQRVALQGVLTSTYAGRTNKVLSVTGRTGATYAEVMEAMDVAHAAGVKIISAVPKGF